MNDANTPMGCDQFSEPCRWRRIFRPAPTRGFYIIIAAKWRFSIRGAAPFDRV
jgi:hypothetical protein